MIASTPATPSEIGPANMTPSIPIEEKIAGSYKGTLDIMMYSDGTSDGVEIAKNFPQKVYLYKVNDETIKMELKNLSVIGKRKPEGLFRAKRVIIRC